jgi:hypothetical protein
MSAHRGYPKDAARRFAVTQKKTQVYRGVLPATQWIFISQTRRGGLGLMDYEGGWGDGDPEAPGAFCMDEHGRIRLRGRIAGGSVGTVAFTLPQGFRPPIPQKFNLANGDAGYAIVEVLPDGTATVTGIV